MTSRFSIFLCLLFLTALASSSAEASDVKMSIHQIGVWDTNPLMVSRNAETVYGSTTTPELTLRSETERNEIFLSGWVDQNFFNRSRYNSTDLHGAAGFNRRNEQWEAGLKTNIDYDTTRTSEITNFGLDVGSVRHFKYEISPEIAFSPTARDKFALGASFQKSIYEGDLYSDYTNASLSPSYSRSLTPITSGVLAFQAQRYQSERDPKRRVDSVGPTLGFITKLTPQFSLRGDAGAQTSQQKGSSVTNTDWKWNYIYSTDIRYEDEQTDITIKASRQRQPFGNGTDSLLTAFTLDGKRDMNADFSINFAASYRFADYEEDPGSNLDKMATGRLGVAYHLTQELDLTGSYEYRKEWLTKNYGTAEQNLGRVGILFRCDLFDTAP